MQNQKNEGKFIISGDGKHRRKYLIFYFLLIIVAFIVAFFVLNFIEGRMSSANRQQYEMLLNIQAIIVILVTLKIALILLKMWQTSLSIATTISVYENAIKGKVTTGFMNCSTESINLYPSTIMNVDVIKNNGLVLYTLGAKYTCYAENNEDIRDKIKGMVNKRK